jgi:hypothetical protein
MHVQVVHLLGADKKYRARTGGIVLEINEVDTLTAGDPDDGIILMPVGDMVFSCLCRGYFAHGFEDEIYRLALLMQGERSENRFLFCVRTHAFVSSYNR